MAPPRTAIEDFCCGFFFLAKLLFVLNRKSRSMRSAIKLKSSYDDLDISVLLVVPDQKPKAVIQLSHGMCGCKERYMPLMEYMAARGIACVAGDHRGHGESIKSMDDLGYMYEGGYRALVSDMRMITDWTHNRFPDVPIYLLGHSMGSLAARVYAKEDDSAISGLILCGSPSLNPMTGVGLALSWLMCTLGMSRYRGAWSQRITSNKYNREFASEGYQAWTCSDSSMRKEFESNTLCNFIMTMNGSYNVLSMMVETYGRGRWAVTNPKMPIVFISGEKDPMMLSEKRFHKSALNLCRRGYTNVTSVIYPDMRHEVLNEIGKEEVWNDILDFMKL